MYTLLLAGTVSRISKEAGRRGRAVSAYNYSVERSVLLSKAGRWPVVKAPVPGDAMGWLNDCVTTSVKGASSPRVYIVGLEPNES